MAKTTVCTSKTPACEQCGTTSAPIIQLHNQGDFVDLCLACSGLERVAR